MIIALISILKNSEPLVKGFTSNSLIIKYKSTKCPKDKK